MFAEEKFAAPFSYDPSGGLGLIVLGILAALASASPSSAADTDVGHDACHLGRIISHVEGLLNADSTDLRLETGCKSDEWLSGALHVRVSDDSYA